MKLRINVTAKDIKNGMIANCQNCPVALAIKRHLHKLPYEYCLVSNSIARFYSHSNVCDKYISFPNRVITFIADFDLNKEVKPFSFTIEL